MRVVRVKKLTFNRNWYCRADKKCQLTRFLAGFVLDRSQLHDREDAQYVYRRYIRVRRPADL